MEKDVITMDHPELAKAPHKLGELLRFIAGVWQPDPSQQELLVAHLMTCSYCRVALLTLLCGEQEYAKREDSSSYTAVHDLLMQLVAIHHKLDAVTCECIGAYAETIVKVGSVLAGQRFPVLAEHMEQCAHCSSILREMLDFLRDP